MTWKTYGSESPGDIVALDVECFYDKKAGISLSKLPTWQYVFHERTFPYLISFHASDWSWVGDPRDFRDWGRLTNKTVVMHNASFDGLVWQRLKRDGVIPDSCRPTRFACTADMVAYLRLSRRSLEFASRTLLGEEMSKEVRDKSDGMTADDMKRDPEFWSQMLKYGAGDAEKCWRLASGFLSQWPAKYQRISELSREAAWRGIPINLAELDRTLTVLEDLENKYLRDLPWYPQEVPTSSKGIRAQGRKDGISVPGSLAKESPEGREFYAKYEGATKEDGSLKFPWVRAVKEYRTAHTLLEKARNLDNGLVGDRFPYSSVFFGANTGRFTAGVKKNGEDDDREDSNKFNLFNLPRDPFHGVDLRGLIVPPKGYKLFVGDYSQVEPRLLLWYAGDAETLRLIREEKFNIYEAMAIKLFGLSPEEARGLKKKNPALYQMAKGMTLGFGYGMAEKKFVLSAPKYTNGQYCPTLDEALKAKLTYRNSSPLVLNYWRRHQVALLSSVYNKDPEHRIQLASGRWLIYYNPQQVKVVDEDTGRERYEIVVEQTRGAEPKRIYGAKCAENVMQATGVDILFDGWNAMADDGFLPFFTLYDECVVPVPDDRPMEHGERLARHMTQSSPWAEGVPLEVEWHIVDKYMK